MAILALTMAAKVPIEPGLSPRGTSKPAKEGVVGGAIWRLTLLELRGGAFQALGYRCWPPWSLLWPWAAWRSGLGTTRLRIEPRRACLRRATSIPGSQG